MNASALMTAVGARLRPLFLPRRRVWSAILLSALVCSAMLVLQHRQREAQNEAIAALAAMRQARIELGKGFLHVALGNHPDSPFQQDQGVALLRQAVSSFDRSLAGFEGLDAETGAEFRRSVQAFQERLQDWTRGGAPEKEAALRIAFHEMERQADRSDAAAQNHLHLLAAKQEMELSLALGLAAALMAGFCLVVFFAGRNEQRAAAAIRQSEAAREKLEEQLRQAQKMEAIGRLAGGVAHDFNNMLNVIIGHAELAQTAVPAASPLADDLQEIIKAGQRSADLTRQLLAFARRQTISPRVLNLNDTIAGMLKMLKRLIGEDIDLLWKPAPHPWPVLMDASQIDQILANLVVNARDAIPGAGKITIETGTADIDDTYCRDHAGFLPGRYVLLEVTDDGCGMDRETQAHIFEPFFTTKEVGKGTGLGLATVYGIVKQNHGVIHVYSEPGKGTTFRLYLPCHEADAAPAEAAARAVEGPAAGTETVLLVEDEETLLRLGRRMLEELGYTVLTADHPHRAVQLAREYPGPIHLLVTDVVMPEMNGLKLREELSRLRPRLKCLFVSGYTANAIAHQGILDRGVHFLGKPFSREELAAKVREALAGHEMTEKRAMF